MAACLPFSATFLVFSDYMKPSIRLGALSKLKVVLRLHARQHRRRRGRPDARAGRAARRSARDSRADGDSSRRCHRDRGSMGLCGRARWPDAVRAVAAEPSASRSNPREGTRRIARRLHLVRSRRRRARSDPDRHRLGSLALREGAGEAGRARRQGARGEHAELESVRSAGRGLSRACATRRH